MSRARLPLIVATTFIVGLMTCSGRAHAEADTRVFGSATAAVMGGIVAGPIGLVAGAAIGYFLGPTLSKVAVPPRRVARRRVRVPVAAAPPQAYPQPMYQQQAYAPQAPQGYLVPAPQQGQPMYLAQVGPVAGFPSPGAVPGVPRSQLQMPQTAAIPPAIASRPVYYSAVPMPIPTGPSGRYAADAYVPQDAGFQSGLAASVAR